MNTPSPHTPTTVAENITRIVQAKAGHDWLDVDVRLVADLGLDSLDMVEIAIDLENTFAIEVRDAHLAEVVTIGDLRTVVMACLASEGRPVVAEAA